MNRVGQPEKKLTRVEMTWDDGSTQVLEGDEARHWLESVNGCIGVASVHHCPLPFFSWKQEKPNGEQTQNEKK